MTDCTIKKKIGKRHKKTSQNVNALSTQMWVPLLDAKNEVDAQFFTTN